MSVAQIFAANTYSQNTRLSVNLKNVATKMVLSQIEDKSQFYFIYDATVIDVEKKISIESENELITSILDKLFEGTNVIYKINDRQIALTATSVSSVMQQQKSISGKVTDSSGAGLPGVSVVVKGTTTGVISDMEGKYTIAKVPENATLMFSFVGMKMQEILVGSKTTINVTLAEDAVSIEEVVAVGYGTMKKSDLTGSVVSVKGNDLNAFPTTNVSQALQGRTSGVQVVQNSGQPGSSMQIRIRGTNSIKGDNSPLWIIDGFPGDQNIINLADVESMEVLKDASATAIYGSRGANGVIIVTTKQGKAGITKVDYEGSFSMQTLRKKMDLLNAKEYMQLQNIQQLNDKGAEYFTQSEINNAGNSTDWQDKMFQKAPMLNHSLTVSGGNEKNQFSIGTGYFDQKGILLNDDGYQRISLRAGVNHNISKKFSISYNAILSRINQDSKYGTSGPFSINNPIVGIIEAAPTLTPYNDDNSYRNLSLSYPFSYDGMINPMMWADEKSNKSCSNKVMANLAFTYKPIDGLSIKIAGNVNNTDYRSDSYTTNNFIGSSSAASISTTQSLHLNSDNIITYHKTINKNHDFSVTGAFTYEEDTYTSLGASGSGFLSDSYETYNLAAASTINTPSSSYSRWTMLSYLGRLNYSYKGRYMATANFRADGSSRYSEGEKWGYFPSVALAWRLSDEKFMKNIAFISNFKLRAGFGETGSTAISPYSTLSMLSTGKAVFGNHQLYTTFAPSTTYPGDLKWETTAQTDAGIDFGIFDNRLNFTVDYYIKNTRDLLNSVQLPQSTGYTNTIKNIGKIQNKGLDFGLSANILNKELKWNVDANISFNRNKVVKLYNGQDITGGTYELTIVQDYINLLREGEPFGIFYGYLEDGYDDSGKIKYKDKDGVAGITTADKTIIGNPNPDYIYSFNTTLSYKNFEFTLYIQGSQGNDIYNLSEIHQNYYYGIGVNTLKEVLYNHWTADTPNAKYPKISKSSSSLKMSDRFVEDGSYMRIKNVQLAYNIPVNRLGMKWIKKGQIYVSGQNLLTITGYSGWDPEVNSNGGGSSINQGLDYYTYPTSKVFTFGLKLGF